MDFWSYFMQSSYEFLPWRVIYTRSMVSKVYVTFYISYLIYSSQSFNKYKLIEKTTEVQTFSMT